MATPSRRESTTRPSETYCFHRCSGTAARASGLESASVCVVLDVYLPSYPPWCPRTISNAPSHTHNYYPALRPTETPTTARFGQSREFHGDLTRSSRGCVLPYSTSRGTHSATRTLARRSAARRRPCQHTTPICGAPRGILFLRR